MRAIFGVVGLLLVLAIVGVLAKKQMKATSDLKIPASPGGVVIQVSPDANAQQQSQQIQQQFKAAAEAAVAQPRSMPDEK